MSTMPPEIYSWTRPSPRVTLTVRTGRGYSALYAQTTGMALHCCAWTDNGSLTGEIAMFPASSKEIGVRASLSDPLGAVAQILAPLAFREKLA